MKIQKSSNNEEIINEAIEVLAHGGVILYPTDTVYGLGANVFNNHAVRKVFEIKKRSFLKPLSVLVSNTQTIRIIAKVSNHQMDILEEYLPGKYTFILNKTNIIPRYVTSGFNKVGVRVPKCEIACNLAGLFPITTTSANISGEEVLNNPSEILEQLNYDVDLVIDVGKLKSNKSSTIIDLTTPKPTFMPR